MAIQSEDKDDVIKFLLSRLPKEVKKKYRQSNKPWDEAFGEINDDSIIATPSIV